MPGLRRASGPLPAVRASITSPGDEATFRYLVAAALKDKYADGMSLEGALSVAIAALAGPDNGDDGTDVTAAQLEVALLDRGRPHRTFRRLTGARLEALLNEAIATSKKTEAIAAKKTTGEGEGEGEKSGDKDKPAGGSPD